MSLGSPVVESIATIPISYWFQLGLGMKYVFEFQQVKRNCGPRALGDVCRAALRRGLPAADVSGGSQNETACGDPG